MQKKSHTMGFSYVRFQKGSAAHIQGTTLQSYLYIYTWKDDRKQGFSVNVKTRHTRKDVPLNYTPDRVTGKLNDCLISMNFLFYYPVRKFIHKLLVHIMAMKYLPKKKKKKKKGQETAQACIWEFAEATEESERTRK